jgi:uncharacterized membrane protein
MESRAKLLGHPAHQVLVVLPLGLLIGSVCFDVYAFWRGDPDWALAAYRMMAVGVVTALVAAPFGTMDWLAIPAGTRAKRIGALHALANLVMLMLIGVSWWLRRGTPSAPGGVAVTLGVLALATMGLSAWLGGELVTRLGVGVSRGAHLDAPSSLTAADMPDGPVRDPLGSQTTGPRRA